ncbi:MAG: hypothetical protein ACRDZO_16615 [Egibacteraceae bacterium]
MATLDWDPVGDELVAVFDDVEHSEIVKLAEGLGLVFDEKAHGRCAMVLATDASLMRGRRARLLEAVLGPTVYHQWELHRSRQQVVVHQVIPVGEQEWDLLGAIWRSLHPVGEALRKSSQPSPRLLRTLTAWLRSTPCWTWPVLHHGKEGDHATGLDLGDIAPALGLRPECRLKRLGNRTIEIRLTPLDGLPHLPLRLEVVVGGAEGMVRLTRQRDGDLGGKVRLDARATNLDRVLLELRSG